MHLHGINGLKIRFFVVDMCLGSNSMLLSEGELIFSVFETVIVSIGIQILNLKMTPINFRALLN